MEAGGSDKAQRSSVRKCLIEHPADPECRLSASRMRQSGSVLQLWPLQLYYSAF